MGGILFFAFFLAFYVWVPRPLFDAPYSTVLESSDGRLLGARIAADQQWRFPAADSVPQKYEKCLLQFEDKYFYYHPGINPVALARALAQNIKAGRTVSGGSTLTMQVCRMARGNRRRSLKNKIVEMIWALNLEFRFTKKEILNMYASHAPFGGNVVGIEAAAWRWYARPPSQLSWAESATLAVLPNAPSLIYPGRLDDRLKEKRDFVLKKLLTSETIDSLTYRLSVAEPLPEKVNALPLNAYHLVEKAAHENSGQRICSTIDFGLQQAVTERIKKHRRHIEANHIYNIAVVVSETATHQVKAYVGNYFDGKETTHSNNVDIIQAPRSTGSILKPFLYCKMIDDGQITPQMLIPDIPTRFGGFTPANFDKEFNGAVPAAEALARSLNIPAVQMLKDYGIPPFYSFLKKAGMTTLTHPPGHYGLSLILGGAEVNLWDLSGMYTSLVSILKNYDENDGFYSAHPFQPLQWEKSEPQGNQQKELRSAQPEVRAAAIYETLEALLRVRRPESEAGWQAFASARNIAWKTGTSFGFRDAWAVGMTRDYVVSVWVGNADGEGRPGLTGITAAAPLLFDIFELLPASAWFQMPVDEMEEIELCAASGYRPGSNCDSIKKVWLPTGSKINLCPFHQRIHLNKKGTYRVDATCYPVAKMTHKNWFVLPPAMEYYFKPRNPGYATLPPLLQGCNDHLATMEFVYPREWNNLFIPTDLDGTPGQLIFELVHRQQKATVFWQIDNEYIGKTTGIHQMAFHPKPGWHILNVTDLHGNNLVRRFFIAGK
ncbi:penicillin-binding protein 1C [Mariniphaga anaerophila]|uniref:peptidoglycan glycosyltransferase n=1 Tax=Mariniphaga anaerophila TaxID=1484053 RepID=A0A1M4SIX5_9BACT|nr:penicillin-binding protein 1C [Mariniphaga anaerophila]SHE32193.1 penicillin-binding protein 1C [Mariniphaga anaerophila]